MSADLFLFSLSFFFLWSSSITCTILNWRQTCALTDKLFALLLPWVTEIYAVFQLPDPGIWWLQLAPVRPPPPEQDGSAGIASNCLSDMPMRMYGITSIRRQICNPYTSGSIWIRDRKPNHWTEETSINIMETRICVEQNKVRNITLLPQHCID